MVPTPEDLTDESRYRLLEEIPHAELVPAIQAHLKRRSPVRTAYILANAAVAAAIAFLWVRTRPPFDEALSHLCLGAALGYLVLMPIHEWIHALTYRRLGAKTTRVVYSFKNLTAYCVADRFVLDGRSFAWVCLMPFLVLNSALLAILATAGGFRPSLWGMLFLHVSACSGDFAFVNLVWAQRREGLWTYDDMANERSLFYTPAQLERIPTRSFSQS